MMIESCMKIVVTGHNIIILLETTVDKETVNVKMLSMVIHTSKLTTLHMLLVLEIICSSKIF